MDLNNAMENDLILILRTLNQIVYTMYSLILYVLSNIQKKNTHTKVRPKFQISMKIKDQQTLYSTILTYFLFEPF